MNLAAINFRSPITWVVIIGGGVAVYFLFRYFQNKNAAAAAAATSPSVPAVGTSLFLEAPPETISTTPTTQGVTPTTTKPPVHALTATYASVQAEAKQEGSSLAKELQDKINAGYTITNVPAGVTLPGKTMGSDTDNDKSSTSTVDKDNDRTSTPTGGGLPTYVHIPTWPYGGQRVRSRLG